MATFDHSSISTFVRSDTDVGQEGLARSLRSKSPQRCSIGLRSGLCVGQSSSPTPNSLIHVFMDFALCAGAQSCCNRKRPSPNCFHKVGSMKSLGMLKHSEFLSLELRGQAQLLKNTIIPPSTKLYIWHNAVRQVPFFWQLPNPDLSIRFPDGEA